jgi:hypothetical protein
MSGFKGAYKAQGPKDYENIVLNPLQYIGVVKGTWAVLAGNFLNYHIIYNTTGGVIGGLLDEIYFNQSVKGGVYNIIISTLRNTNTCTFQMLVDGIPYGDIFDTWNPSLTAIFSHTVRNIHLEQGIHTFSFRVVGKNASSSAYFFDFQQLIIQKQ